MDCEASPDSDACVGARELLCVRCGVDAPSSPAWEPLPVTAGHSTPPAESDAALPSAANGGASGATELGLFVRSSVPLAVCLAPVPCSSVSASSSPAGTVASGATCPFSSSRSTSEVAAGWATGAWTSLAGGGASPGSSPEEALEPAHPMTFGADFALANKPLALATVVQHLARAETRSKWCRSDGLGGVWIWSARGSVRFLHCMDSCAWLHSEQCPGLAALGHDVPR